MFRKLFDKASPILALLGGAIYGVARVAHDRFYESLDVTPEDVGLTQTTILGRAVLYLCFFLLASLIVLGVLVGATLLLRAVLGRFSSDRNWIDWLAKIVTGLLIELPLQFEYEFFFATLERRLASAALGLGMIGLVAAAIGFMRSTDSDKPKWGGGGVVAAAAVVLGMFFLAADRGEVLAERVLDGKEISGDNFALLNIHAERVCVEWLDDLVPADLPTNRPVMYLGEGDRWLVLVDHHEGGTTLRLPPGKATLSSITEDACA